MILHFISVHERFVLTTEYCTDNTFYIYPHEELFEPGTDLSLPFAKGYIPTAL